ncbi:MAG: hypothetical protein JSV05_03880 [Candidatus Bathyarchaeota archaeon]|nr:MAG: hypothetical protein JSV05_03880 [Candidatus Bathyarchaeota archaeon]
MGKENERPARRFSSFVFIVIIVGVIFSLVVLFQAWEAYQNSDPLTGLFLLIGFVGLILSAYMLIQARRQVRRFTLEVPPVVTTIICSKCGFKNVRNFEREDYILKELGPCTKCDGTMMISAIYREVEEKKRESRLFG